MNNEAPKFDPITGQPITSSQEQNNQTSVQNSESNATQNNANSTVQSNDTNNSQNSTSNEVPKSTDNNTQPNMQSIATVDQSNEQFINNVQSDVEKQNNQKQEKASYTFLVILFIIIFAAIFFLFPILNKH